MLLFFLQSDPNAWNETIAKATVIVAGANILYLVTTVLLWLTTRRSVNITRDMFEASHRPYIAIVGFQKIIKDSPRRVEVITQFTNVGTVPAHNLILLGSFIPDGVVIPNVQHEEETTLVAFPQITQDLTSFTTGQQEYEAVTNAKELAFIVKCTYKGVTNKDYSTYCKIKYDVHGKDFVIVKQSAT